MRQIFEDDSVVAFGYTNSLVNANSFLIYVKPEQATYLFDPGSDVEALQTSVRQGLPAPAKILLTHGHFDHVAGAASLAETWGSEIYMHGLDRKHLMRNNFYMRTMGFLGTCTDFAFQDLREVEMINASIRVIETPGHSAGSCIFLHESFAVTGDTLLSTSVFSKTVSGFDHSQQAHSVKAAWSEIAQSAWMLPGHGTELPPAEVLTRNRQLAALMTDSQVGVPIGCCQ